MSAVAHTVHTMTVMVTGFRILLRPRRTPLGQRDRDARLEGVSPT
jgi:hypothetical protein